MTLSPDIVVKYNDVRQTMRDVNGVVVYPVVNNGTTYLPIRAVSNMLGVDVKWDQETRTVSLYSADFLQTGAIPDEGGRIEVSGPTLFSFTPDRTGAWQFITSDNGGADPYLTLYGADGAVIIADDDGGPGLNSLLIAYLEAGATYSVRAGFYNNGTGAYALTASPATVLTPAGGGTLVESAARYAFMPDYTGLWTFRTSDCGESDPYLKIFGPDGAVLAENDDVDAGDLNSLITIPLSAGVTYSVGAGFFSGGSGEYTLTASQHGAAAAISASGGRRGVNNATFFAFTPGISGTWRIDTSGEGEDDPCLTIYFADGRVAARDDDSGEDLNAQITIDLDAGTLYYIHAGFFSGETGSCTLSVTLLQGE